jgi:hypothetical protein
MTTDSTDSTDKVAKGGLLFTFGQSARGLALGRSGFYYNMRQWLQNWSINSVTGAAGLVD